MMRARVLHKYRDDVRHCLFFNDEVLILILNVDKNT